MIKTRQQLKIRSNVESMVSFDGVNQYASAGVNQNVINAIDYNKKFAISCLVYINGLNQVSTILCIRSAFINSNSVNIGTFRFALGRDETTGKFCVEVLAIQGSNGSFYTYRTDYFLLPDRLYSIVLRKTTTQFASNTSYVATVNRVSYPLTRVASSSEIGNTFYRGNDELTIGTTRTQYNNSLSSLLSGGITHLSIFNDDLGNEFDYIHQQGGLVPASAHANCVAHYPCTQREGNMLWDVVQQYNYTKEPLQMIYTPVLSDTDWTGSATFSGGIATINNNNDGSNGSLNLASSKFRSMEAGRTYRVEVDVINYVAGRISISLGSRLSVGDTTITGDGTYSRTVTPTAYDLGGTKYINITVRPTGTNVNYQISAVRFIPISHPVLTPYHAQLFNFTETQHSGSAQTAWKDFYSKENLYPFAFVPKVKNYRFNSDILGNASTGIFPSNSSFTTVICGYTQGNGTFSGDGEALFHVQSTNLMLSWRTNNLLRFRFAGALYDLPNVAEFGANAYQLFIIVCVYNSTNSSLKMRLKLINSPIIYSADHTTVAWSRPNDANIRIGSGNYGLSKFILSDSVVSDAVINEALGLNFNNIVSPLVNVDFSQQVGATVKNKGTFSDFVLFNTTTQVNEPESHTESWLEKASLLPPLRNALKFKASASQHASIPLSFDNAKGYSVVYCVANLSVISASLIWNKQITSGDFQATFSNGNITTAMGNGGAGSAPVPHDTSFPFQMICATIEPVAGGGCRTKAYSNGRKVYDQFGINVTLKETANTANSLFLTRRAGGTNTMNATFLMFCICKGVVTAKQAAEMWNNSLLMQPKKEWSNLEWQLLPDFNQIIDTAGVFSLPNNVSVAGNLTLSGYTANNLDPLHADYALQSINSLR